MSTVCHGDHSEFLVREIEDEESGPQDSNLWTYGGRWYQLFQKLEAGFTKPTIFSCGHGDWRDHAFKGRDQSRPQLERARYVALDGGTGLSQWEEPRRIENSYESFRTN